MKSNKRSLHLYTFVYPGSRGPNAEKERQQKEKPKVKRMASGLSRWESHFHVGIWFRFWTLSLLGFLNSYPGATVDIWYNNDSYWLSICRHGSKVDNMEVRFSTAEAGGPSLCFRFFFLLSLSALGLLEPRWCFNISKIVKKVLYGTAMLDGMILEILKFLNYSYFTKIMTRKPKIGNLTNITELYPFPQSKKWHDVTSHENQGPIIFSSRK